MGTGQGAITVLWSGMIWGLGQGAVTVLWYGVIWDLGRERKL